jgi:hypothetical protein
MHQDLFRLVLSLVRQHTLTPLHHLKAEVSGEMYLMIKCYRDT